MPASNLTVVMYHYVRPIAGSRYPGIKGLELALFKEQLDYISRRYAVVTIESVIGALQGIAPLPANPVLLTFDDGYRDHHDFVLPVLVERKLEGSFFVPASPVLSREVLDVNKIHFILAAAPAAAAVAGELDAMISAAASEGRGLPAVSELRGVHWSATRFDAPDVAYVKRLLQRVLPEDFRATATARLFRQFVSADESGFAEELYLSPAHLREMTAAGMHIGGHGDRHHWLGSITPARQAADIAASRAFVKSVGRPGAPFTFCYPYGDYDGDTLSILEASDCAIAFTTRVALAPVPGTPRLEMPRLDTNDLPPMARSLC